MAASQVDAARRPLRRLAAGFRAEVGPARDVDAGSSAQGVGWIGDASRADGLDSTYDIVVECTSTGSGAPAVVRPWAEAGATWWLEANWVVEPHEVMEVSGARLRQGPPRAL